MLTKCPACDSKTLSKYGKYIRCKTCGWKELIEILNKE